MFWIWDVAGRSTPWTPGSRGVSPVAPAAPVRAVDPGGPDPWRRALDRQQGPRTRTTRVKTAGDLMRAPVFSLSPAHTVAEGWTALQDRGLRHLPLLGPQGHVVGIVSDRDLLRATGGPLGGPPALGPAELGAQPLRAFMRAPVYTASPDAPLRDVAEVMLDRHIGAMLITDEAGALIGILTRSDILRGLVHEAPLDLWI